MDWKTCAVDDLRHYKQMKIGILNSRDKLRMLESSVNKGRITAGKRGKQTDSRIIDMIVESERLKNNIKVAEELTSLVDRGLSSLTDEERIVLEDFYVSDSPKGAKKLYTELGYAPRSLYRLRDSALKKFTLAMYGVELL